MKKANFNVFVVAVVAVVLGLFILTGFSIYNSVSMDNISNIDIAYKAITLGGSYYAIGEEGGMYHITQEQWAGLDVPIIAVTK
jgi:hypothetical protein